jgi:hypothetical protein
LDIPIDFITTTSECGSKSPNLERPQTILSDEKMEKKNVAKIHDNEFKRYKGEPYKRPKWMDETGNVTLFVEFRGKKKKYDLMPNHSPRLPSIGDKIDSSLDVRLSVVHLSASILDTMHAGVFYEMLVFDLLGSVLWLNDVFRKIHNHLDQSEEHLMRYNLDIFLEKNRQNEALTMIFEEVFKETPKEFEIQPSGKMDLH